MSDLFSKFDPLIRQREELLSTGVTDPFNLVMEKVESPTVAICNGKRTILLGTYNYMGMTFDPDVIAAGKKALDDFGSGTTGSRVLNGTYSGHRAVEQGVACQVDVGHPPLGDVPEHVVLAAKSIGLFQAQNIRGPLHHAQQAPRCRGPPRDAVTGG